MHIRRFRLALVPLVSLVPALSAPPPAAATPAAEGVAACIRRAAGGPVADLGLGEYELEMRGTRVRLDLYLGPAPGGFHLFASSADPGWVRAWFHPAADAWVVTDRSDLVRTFGRDTAPAGAARDGGTAWWPLAGVADGAGNSVRLDGVPDLNAPRRELLE